MPATYRDPAARRDALDGWGLDQQVIFPNWGLNFGLYLQGDAESERANIGAWNRWAADIADVGEGRLLSGRSPDPAGRTRLDQRTTRRAWRPQESGRCSCRSDSVDGKRLSHPEFEHVWAQMVDLALVPTFHIGAFAERTIADGYQDGDIIQYMTLQSLVMNGLEAQIALVRPGHQRCVRPPSEAELGRRGILGRLDSRVPVQARHGLRRPLQGGRRAQRRPWRTSRRPISTSTSGSCRSRTSDPGKVMDRSTDNIMFGSDYPHAEGLLNPLEDYREKAGDLGEREPAFYGGTLTDALDRAAGVRSLARQ